MFSDTRWQFVYRSQSLSELETPRSLQEIDESSKPYKSVSISSSEFGNETLSYLEFSKYSINEDTINDTSREITYNDGIYYIFDVYKDMLNQKYDK